MSSLFSLLGTMGSALSAQQEGLNVTGQNVSNVNTPGYVDQRVVMETNGTGDDSDGGVNATVQSTFDAFTYGQVLTQQGLSGAANARSEALNEAQNVVAPQGGDDVGSEMTSFFSSLEALSANPSDSSARSGVLASAQAVAQTFSSAANGLAQQQASLLSQAQGVATQVNSDLSQIATLNGQIAQNTASGNPSPDLSDQLDSVVGDVANLVGASVVQNPSGGVTLFAAGVALVSGDSASALDVSAGPTGAMQITVNQPGAAPTDVTSNITEGTLGGLREARDVDIAQSASQLDQLAYGFANAVNAVQQSGYGLDGVTGRPLFTPPTQVAGAAANMSVDASVAGQPNAIAATANPQDLPGGNDSVLALEQVANQSLGGGGTPSQQYAALTSQIGNAASAASTEATTRSETLTQAQNLNSSASGVSLNEETVNMTQFQQAFEAATQVLTVASDLLGNFISQMSGTTA